MKITYELTRKDILAFQISGLLRNRTLRFIYLGSFLLTAYNTLAPYIIYFSSVGWGEAYERGMIRAYAPAALLDFGSAIFVMAAITVGLNAIYFAFLMVKFKENDGTLGQHLIELRDEHLLEATDVNESLAAWKGVGKIVNTRNYIYLYVSPTNAHVIPKRAFASEADAGLFIDEVERRRDAAAAKYTPSMLTANT